MYSTFPRTGSITGSLWILLRIKVRMASKRLASGLIQTRSFLSFSWPAKHKMLKNARAIACPFRIDISTKNSSLCWKVSVHPFYSCCHDTSWNSWRRKRKVWYTRPDTMVPQQQYTQTKQWPYFISFIPPSLNPITSFRPKGTETNRVFSAMESLLGRKV